MSFELHGFPAYAFIFMLLLLFVGIPIVVISVLASRASRMIHKKRKEFRQLIIAEYEVPDDLSPAEIGYMFDSRLGRKELLATIVSLEQQHLLEVKSGAFGVMWLSLGTSKSDTLRPHEQWVVDAVSRQPSGLMLRSLKMKQFQSTVKASLVSRGYISEQKASIDYGAQRSIIAYFAISLLCLIVLIRLSDSLSTALVIYFFFGLLFLPVFIILGIVAGTIYNAIVGQPGIWTKKQQRVWPDVQGYRDYVEQVELDNLQFESRELEQRSKNNALPYAIALGFNTEWRRR